MGIVIVLFISTTLAGSFPFLNMGRCKENEPHRPKKQNLRHTLTESERWALTDAWNKGRNFMNVALYRCASRRAAYRCIQNYQLRRPPRARGGCRNFKWNDEMMH